MRRVTLCVALAVALASIAGGGAARAQCMEHLVLSDCPVCPAPGAQFCRKPRPGHQPSVNGCGPDWFPDAVRSKLAPQGFDEARWATPAGDGACDLHDKCYETCGTSKNKCDKDFHNQMDAACRKAFAPPGRDEFFNHLGVCLSRAKLYFNLVSSGGDTAFETAQDLACLCCCNKTPGVAPRAPSRGAATLVCTPPSFVGASSSVITDATPSYRISAQVTWTYDPATSFGTEWHFHPVGTVSFAPYAAGCIAISPATFAVTKDNGGELIVDYSTNPPTYNGAGSTLWQAAYSDTCSGGSFMAGAGGAWFFGSGTLSAAGTTIAGTQSAVGQTFTFSFVAQ